LPLNWTGLERTTEEESDSVVIAIRREQIDKYQQLIVIFLKVFTFRVLKSHKGWKVEELTRRWVPHE
jgi:hypothetical protein